MRPHRFVVASIGLVFLAGVAQATDYDESVSGDLSGNRLSPTRIVLSMGAVGSNGLSGNNIIAGRTGRASGVVDRDYFTAVVPAGFMLSELRLGNQTTVGGGGSFLGLARGAVLPIEPTVSDATGLLGALVYTTSMRGTDILDDLGAGGSGASGFARPLAAGDYTFWVQELATGSFNYRFNLVLSPVPELPPAALFAAGLALLAGLRRYNKRVAKT